MEKMSGARSLMVALEKEGVELAFGLPGGANLPIYDELYKSNIRHILVRHEQSASHMADGFGRVSRRPGVCFATSGPGATNIVTGIATAQADSAPMIAITGQVPSKMIGRDAFQESDIIGITNPIVKYAFQPMDAAEIPTVVKKAFYISSTGRPGPVLIDIPKDVQQNEAEMHFPNEVKIRGYHPWVDPDIREIDRAIDMLLSAERPIILAGGGVIISGAFAELQSIAELLMIPVVTTFKGKGSFPENHPLSLGPIGMHGHAEANKMMVEADCVLACGSRFSDRSVGTFEEFEKNLKIIHMDVDPAEIGKNQTTNVAEVGQHQMWASLFFDVIHPGTFFSSTGLGTMGWGFPAAIGAKAAKPDVPVLDIAGEGSFNMTENSLAVSVLDNLPVIVFLMNNFSLGMVAQWQRTFYDRRMIGIDLKDCPDYVKIAEAYGAQGIRAETIEDVGKAVQTALKSNVATVIDIPMDPQEDVLPFVAHGTSLK